MLDKKGRFWLWFLALFRKDMADFKEREDDKKKIYDNIAQYMQYMRERRK